MGRPFIDYTGKRVGKFTVLGRVPSDKKYTTWRVVCDCGREQVIGGSHFGKLDDKTTGCKYCKHLAHSHKIKDEVGNRYGKLLVIRRSYDRTGLKFGDEKRARWECLCDCGNMVLRMGHQLRSGTKSCGCLKKFPLGEGSFNSLLRVYQTNAKKRSLVWELSDEVFRELVNQNCHYCGQVPSQIFSPSSRHNGHYIYNGIDRVDSTKGYVTGNVVSACGTCNRLKMDMPYQEFYQWIHRVHGYWNP